MAFTLKKHTSNQLESARLNDVNDNWGDIEQAIDTLQTNASLLSGIVLTDDLDGFAATVNHAEIKFFMTESAYTFGAKKTFRAVGFAATRWTVRFMLAFAANGALYTRLKTDDSAPWTDWVEH
jgi:hypothetical protein